MGVMDAGKTNVGEVRRSHKVTQEAMAEMLGVSPKHISHVENATSCLTVKAVYFYIVSGIQNRYNLIGQHGERFVVLISEDKVIKATIKNSTKLHEVL